MSGVIKFRKDGITLKELDEALAMGGMMRVDMGKLLEMMSPEQREKLYPKGYPMNGKYPDQGCVQPDVQQWKDANQVQAEGRFNRAERGYVLGFTINGKRVIVYHSNHYPNGMHDLMSNICNEFVKQFPNDRISWFNECDGVAYSY